MSEVTFNNVKPSQLPENTVIGTEAPHYEELYIKRETYWEDLFSGCGHCDDPVRVKDKNFDVKFKHMLTTDKLADEFFTDFKVIAVPPGFSLSQLEQENILSTMTNEELHARHLHPDYEYAVTSGPRKSWNDAEEPPFGRGDMWERNVDAGRNGWERFDFHEESYWRRKKQ